MLLVSETTLLCLEVEDDGKGYPDEVMEYMRDDTRPNQNGSRVGLWSVKRLLELMYDRKGLMELDNVLPHGALSRIYIPEKPVNELGTEHLAGTGLL